MSKAWAPRIIVVYEAGVLKGCVCMKELKVVGIPTGLYFADATADRKMVVAAQEDTANVLKSALDFLFDTNTVRGLRMFVPMQGPEMQVARDVAEADRIKCQLASIQYHVSLPLAQTYEGFLETLGSETRRNLRRYRRNAAKNALVFVPSLSLSEFSAEAERMLRNDKISKGVHAVERGIRMIEHVERPLLAGLRRQNGEWLSLVTGWYEGDKAWIFCQMNQESDYPKLSISTVMRSHLIQELIEKDGVKELMFWGGCGGLLSRFCKPVPATAVCFDSPSYLWGAARWFVRRATKRLPRRFARQTHWVSPRNASSLTEKPAPHPVG